MNQATVRFLNRKLVFPVNIRGRLYECVLQDLRVQLDSVDLPVRWDNQDPEDFPDHLGLLGTQDNKAHQVDKKI